MADLIALMIAISVSFMAGRPIVEAQHYSMQTIRDSVTAYELKEISDAGTNYIEQNYSALSGNSGTTTVTVPELISADVLDPSFQPESPFGQVWEVQINKSASGTLQGVVISTGGSPMTEAEANQAATRSEGVGGDIPYAVNGNTSYAVGAYGGWKLSMANYTNPGPGHMVGLLAYNSGQQLDNDQLYRVAVPGQPQLNTMQTTLDMGGNNIENGEVVQADYSNDSGGTSTAQVANPHGGYGTYQIGSGATASSFWGGSDGSTAIDSPAGLAVMNGTGTAAQSITKVQDIHSQGTDYADNGAVAIGTGASTACDSAAALNIGNSNFTDGCNGTTNIGVDQGPNGLLYTNGHLLVNKQIGSMGLDPSGTYPSGWAGGLHTWDVYAEASVGVGSNGSLNAGMNSDGGTEGDIYETSPDGLSSTSLKTTNTEISKTNIQTTGNSTASSVDQLFSNGNVQTNSVDMNGAMAGETIQQVSTNGVAIWYKDAGPYSMTYENSSALNNSQFDITSPFGTTSMVDSADSNSYGTVPSDCTSNPSVCGSSDFLALNSNSSAILGVSTDPNSANSASLSVSYNGGGWIRGISTNSGSVLSVLGSNNAGPSIDSNGYMQFPAGPMGGAGSPCTVGPALAADGNGKLMECVGGVWQDLSY